MEIMVLSSFAIAMVLAVVSVALGTIDGRYLHLGHRLHVLHAAAARVGSIDGGENISQRNYGEAIG